MTIKDILIILIALVVVALCISIIVYLVQGEIEYRRWRKQAEERLESWRE